MSSCCLEASLALAVGRSAQCACGAVLERVRPAKRLQAKPASTTAVVSELLAYATALAWVDSAAYGSGGILRGALIGAVNPDAPVWVGNGCSASVPLGDRREAPHVRPPSAETARRLRGLSDHARAVAGAVMRDGQGHRQLTETRRRGGEDVTELVYPVVWSHGRFELRGGLEVRLGWKLAPDEVRTRWQACVVGGDKRMAEAGARSRGAKALETLAKEWGGGTLVRGPGDPSIPRAPAHS